MNNVERVQKILDRGLYDKLSDDQRARVDIAIQRGLVTMGAVTPTQPHPQESFGGDSLQPDLTQQHPVGSRNTMHIGGDESTERKFVDLDRLARGAVGTVGGFAGLAAGGGNPLSGAGGYALADLLYQKYTKGEEITPLNATKRFGEGLAYELAPKAAVAGAGRILGGVLPMRKMYSTAVGVPSNIVQKEADRITDVGLHNKLSVSQGGIKKAQEKLNVNKKKLDEVINTASDEGAVIDLEGIVNRAKQSLSSNYENVLVASKEKKNIMEEVDDVLKELLADYKHTYKQAKGSPQRQINIPLKEAQKIKTKTQNFVNKEYTNAVKFNKPVGSASKYEIRAALAKELRRDIEKVANVKDLNSKSHDLMSWLGHASNRVRHASTQPMIPTRVLAPAIIETSMKGAPGSATMLGSAGVASVAATPMSLGARGAHAMRKAGGNKQYWKQRIPLGLSVQQAVYGQPPSDDFYADIHKQYMDMIKSKPKRGEDPYRVFK